MSEAQGAGPSQQTALNATPRSGKSHGGTFAQTRLRAAIAREMVNEILECPIDAFLEHYAPFKPSPEVVIKAFNDLKDNSLVEEIENGDNSTTADNELEDESRLKQVDRAPNKVWTLAPFTTPPRGMKKEKEPAIFKRLEGIMRVLEAVGYTGGEKGAKRGRPFSYKDTPSNSMASEIQGTNFKVDACITSDLEAKRVVLSDVVTIAEFKKKSNPANIKDNRLKLISAAAQIMNDDPRRMWVYGITIEDTQMAVWYFCRSHSVKSASFNFTTDISTFINVFLSLLYATRPEIGYDPTVHRVEHNNEICYVYELGTKKAPRYYRTIEPLFMARGLCITGRKTRVWRVVEVKGFDKGQFGKEKGGHVVLKDGWLDEDAKSEKENQDVIFERLSKIQPSDYAWATEYLHQRLAQAFQGEKYRDYFMEVLESRRIGKTKARLQSAVPTPQILLFPEPTPTSSRHNTVDGSTQTKDHSGMPASAASLISGHEEEDTSHREYKTKEQHRLIYRQVGCVLSAAEDLPTSFRAIYDTFIALVLLYLARWTHRDISVGNIIVVGKGDSARGKLSDLEYAKEFDDNSFSADPKTGTPFFMPYEIHSSVSVAIARSAPLPLRQIDPFASYEKREPQPDNRRPIFPRKFQFQHDLESLWWVMLWIVLHRVGGTKALALVKKIFTYTRAPSKPRIQFFLEQTPDLKESLDNQLQVLAPFFIEIQNTLLNFYASKETTGTLAHAAYAVIYEPVWTSLGYILNHVLQTQGVTFQDLDSDTMDSDPEPLDSDTGSEATGVKEKKRKPKTEDDHEYRPNRQGSTRGKAAPTGPRVDRPRRNVPRRQVG